MPIRDLPLLAVGGAASPNPGDDAESYASGTALNGLNGGTGWDGPYVDRANWIGIINSDDMESYADGVAVNGLDGGVWAGGPYVDR